MVILKYYIMNFCRINLDEVYICDLANTIEGVNARMATPEEDCGYQKADVVIEYNGEISYLQVSHTPKSKGEIDRLAKRGTYPISTHKFRGMSISDNNLLLKIKTIIKK
mgnify:FL=1|jgi:hypothetical protein